MKLKTNIKNIFVYIIGYQFLTPFIIAIVIPGLQNNLIFLQLLTTIITLIIVFKKDYLKLIKLPSKEETKSILIYLLFLSGINILLSFIGDMSNVSISLNQQSLENNINNKFIFIVVVVVCVPILEEIIFRDNLSVFFKKEIPFLIVSSLIFALPHLLTEILTLSINISFVINFLAYMSVGFALSKIYLKHNLRVSILLHILWNLIAVIPLIM